MRNTLTITGLALLAVALSTPAAAQGSSGGQLSTLERGAYICETPGDAALGRGIVQANEGFTIENASSYTSLEGSGTYLRVGNMVTMTSGPKKGTRYSLKSERFLRKIAPDGTQTDIRCVKRWPAPN